jgi:hypothetical protein
LKSLAKQAELLVFFVIDCSLREMVDEAFRGFTWGLYEELLKNDVKNRKRKFDEADTRSYTHLGGLSQQEEMRVLVERNRNLQVHLVALLDLTKLGGGGPAEEEIDQTTCKRKELRNRKNYRSRWAG